MASKLVLLGLASGGLGAFFARSVFKTWRNMQKIAQLTGGSPFVHYYKGGFYGKMSPREAALILNVSEFAGKERIKAAHRKIMLMNHPDRGGSPYIASKINEAKSLLENPHAAATSNTSSR